MTNQERNIKVAKLLGYTFIARQDKNIWCEKNNYRDWFKFNPCENWGQLMPLALEYDVQYQKNTESNDYEAYSLGAFFCSFNKDPRLAVVDCLISALESKQDGTN